MPVPYVMKLVLSAHSKHYVHCVTELRTRTAAAAFITQLISKRTTLCFQAFNVIQCLWRLRRLSLERQDTLPYSAVLRGRIHP